MLYPDADALAERSPGIESLASLKPTRPPRALLKARRSRGHVGAGHWAVDAPQNPSNDMAQKKVQSARNVIAACQPRKDVLEGELEDAIFAADFGQLIEGTAPKVYGNAAEFFRNTEPTPDLRKICSAVFEALANKKESGQLIRLSTGFGGGKTHTLMALWHLARNIDDLSVGSELLPAAKRPASVRVVAVDLAKAGHPEFARHGGTRVHSLQGEIFYQLGGAKALKALGAADHPEACPPESVVAEVLGKEPLLILLDELVIYMAGLSDTGQHNLLSFLTKLISVVSNRTQAVLVITDPGQQTAYAGVSSALAAKIAPAAVKLEDILGRKMTDFDPVGKQAARVIVRRLFAKVDPQAADAVSAAYHQLYLRVHEAHSDLLPQEATATEYAERIRECYPFHPRLIDTAKERLGPLPEFQRSRGVLRLFARLVRDIWRRQPNLELITAADINWSSEEIRGDLLQRLRREQFAAAVDADLERHAQQLDDDQPDGIHYRVASALLLESLPRTDHSGLDAAELTLAVLRTDEAGHEPSEALDRLVAVCWHTYPMGGGRGWQFRFEPNVIKQIEQQAATISLEDALDRVQAEVQGFFGGPLFGLRAWPESPADVPEDKELQLVLCADEDLAVRVCSSAGGAGADASLPRRFRNAIVAVAPNESALQSALDRARRLIAAEHIEREARRSQGGALVLDQLKRIKPNITREFRIQACRAFSLVVGAEGVLTRNFWEKYQVPDDDILGKPQGQKGLRRFLEETGRLYGADDALDPDLFLDRVLPGTTPIPDQPGVFRLSDIHERLLSAPGLRLIPDVGVIRRTLLRALETDRVVIRTPDGTAYDAEGAVTGPPGQRRRVRDLKPTLRLARDELLAPAHSTAAAEWLKTDTPQPKKQEPLNDKDLPQPQKTVAVSWEEAARQAQERPLLELRLDARTPSAADTLAHLAQPFSADALLLEVTIDGGLKAGGHASLSVQDAKLNSPIRPLDLAKRLFNAMEPGMQYGARLTLKFNPPGRLGLGSLLTQAEEQAGHDIQVEALFGPPVGAASQP